MKLLNPEYRVYGPNGMIGVFDWPEIAVECAEKWAAQRNTTLLVAVETTDRSWAPYTYVAPDQYKGPIS
jgi:hypothetical protein